MSKMSIEQCDQELKLWQRKVQPSWFITMHALHDASIDTMTRCNLIRVQITHELDVLNQIRNEHNAGQEAWSETVRFTMQSIYDAVKAMEERQKKIKAMAEL